MTSSAGKWESDGVVTVAVPARRFTSVSARPYGLKRATYFGALPLVKHRHAGQSQERLIRRRPDLQRAGTRLPDDFHLQGGGGSMMLAPDPSPVSTPRRGGR